MSPRDWLDHKDDGLDMARVCPWCSGERYVATFDGAYTLCGECDGEGVRSL